VKRAGTLQLYCFAGGHGGDVFCWHQGAQRLLSWQTQCKAGKVGTDHLWVRSKRGGVVGLTLQITVLKETRGIRGGVNDIGRHFQENKRRLWASCTDLREPGQKQ